MRKVLIGAIAIVMMFGVANIYACPGYDKAKGQAEASKAGACGDDGTCHAAGTKVQTTVANSNDNVPTVQVIEKKTNKKSNSKATIRPANYVPAVTTDSAKDKKSAAPPNRQDMASSNKDN
jgi:hypothetical protein